MVFNPSFENLSKILVIVLKRKLTFLSLDSTIAYAPLKLIQIYFDTATYDEIERDVKMTLTAQIGLIGGTMGLLTGFSILSGVEIIYFAVKLFMSLRIPRGKQITNK